MGGIRFGYKSDMGNMVGMERKIERVSDVGKRMEKLK